MGQTTPNIGIYIPSAGETNYDASFLAGMINVDQHDHSGPPNKGVPIASSGLADGSVTFSKLNANVADNATGIGTETGPNANKLTMLGYLKNLYILSQVPSTGIVVMNGSAALARTITGTAGRVTVANGDGVSGNPTIDVAANAQVSFIANKTSTSAGVTGDGTTYTVIFDNVISDTGSNYNNATGTFTAPVDGNYYFSARVNLQNVQALNTDGNTIGFLVSSGASYLYNCGNASSMKTTSSTLAFAINQVIKLTAGQTVVTQVTLSGAALAVDVQGAASPIETEFGGYLLL